jgi:protein-S-isoprenylcysteine O-methyltransferase Ste14
MKVTEMLTSMLRFLPLAGIMSILFIGVAWRAWWQWRRYRTWGLVRSGLTEPGQAARAAIFILVFTMLAAQAFRAAMNPDGVSAATWLASDGFLILSTVGAIFLATGLVLLVVAQLQMGASWRIGIDETATPGLIETGLFRFSRNPIYMALLVIVAGYVALLPTLTSLLLWAGAYLGIRLQIYAEEAYLRRSYGEAYDAYARRVGRLLPGLRWF